MEATDTSLIQWFATLGVGGVLAGAMFMFWRKDMKDNLERFQVEAHRNRETEHAEAQRNREALAVRDAQIQEILAIRDTQAKEQALLGRELMTLIIGVVKENTDSNVSLKAAVDALHRRLDSYQMNAKS